MLLLPFPPDLAGNHGGARATGAMLEMLARRYELSVLYLLPPGLTPPARLPKGCNRLHAVPIWPLDRGLKRFGRQLFHAIRLFLWGAPDWVEDAWSPEMAMTAASLANEIKPDIVHFEFHVMSQYISTVREVAPRAVYIVTEHEPGVSADDYLGEKLPVRKRLSALARRRAWARFERRSLLEADAVITFTNKDKEAIHRLVGTAGPHVVSIPLRSPVPFAGREVRTVPSDLLFIGNFRHPPNVDAARRLISAIFPRIRQSRPATTLLIVGTDPPVELLSAAREGVGITGWVDDTAPYLHGASVFVAPLRQGGGMRIKVLEACAHGKALIASPLAVEGLSLNAGVEFLLADTDDEFVENALELLRSPRRRRKLEDAARRWAVQTQNADQWLLEYEALYRRLTIGVSESVLGPLSH